MFFLVHLSCELVAFYCIKHVFSRRVTHCRVIDDLNLVKTSLSTEKTFLQDFQVISEADALELLENLEEMFSLLRAECGSSSMTFQFI